MFSAIIFACSLHVSECQTISHPRIFTDKKACMTNLSVGVVDVQMQGWRIEQFTCYEWAKEV